MPTPLLMHDGSTIPAIGLGLYKVDAEDAARVVTAGIEHGYGLIDGAALYDNQRELGEAVRASGRRDELLLTTKLWGDPDQSREAAFADLERSEAELDGSFDCYLIHWPRAPRNTYVETWRAFQELRDAGRVRIIGVCNFDETELQRLHDETGEWPAINQVESHPWLPQHALRAFHAEHGIVTQAWSPLGRGRLLQDATLVDIATAHARSVAQVVLRWHLQLGGAVVVKSVHETRIAENVDVDGFTLSDDDMAAIATLESGERTGTHPKDRP